MKLHFLDRSNTESKSFTFKHNSYPNFLKIWHYHPELELVHIVKSTGTRFIGDSIQKFKEGEVILIGENLPHMWLNNAEYFEENSILISEAIAIHFKKEFLGLELLSSQEFILIKKMIDESKYGLKFINIDQEIKDMIISLTKYEGFDKLLIFLQILNELSKHSKVKRLTSTGFHSTFVKTGNKNLDKSYEHIFKNFTKSISLEEIAEIANMNPSAFSRFFKRIHRKGFKEYLNEIRIGYACKLLIENEHNITTICYESGFNNISNFNRQFKKIKGKSPSDYLSHYNQIVTNNDKAKKV
jgi:YesN/AraC family two-component response regulator